MGAHMVSFGPRHCDSWQILDQAPNGSYLRSATTMDPQLFQFLSVSLFTSESWPGMCGVPWQQASASHVGPPWQGLWRPSTGMDSHLSSPSSLHVQLSFLSTGLAPEVEGAAWPRLLHQCPQLCKAESL